MLTVVTKPEEVQNAVGEIRAGGTDLHDRYRLGVSAGAIIDIHKIDFGGIVESKDGSLTIGAASTLTIDGTYTQSSDARLIVGLGGNAGAAAACAFGAGCRTGTGACAGTSAARRERARHQSTTPSYNRMPE